MMGNRFEKMENILKIADQILGDLDDHHYSRIEYVEPKICLIILISMH